MRSLAAENWSSWRNLLIWSGVLAVNDGFHDQAASVPVISVISWPFYPSYAGYRTGQRSSDDTPRKDIISPYSSWSIGCCFHSTRRFRTNCPRRLAGFCSPRPQSVTSPSASCSRPRSGGRSPTTLRPSFRKFGSLVDGTRQPDNRRRRSPSPGS